MNTIYNEGQNPPVKVEVVSTPPESKPVAKATMLEKFVKITDTAPRILWPAFAMFILWLFYDDIKYKIIPNITSFKIAGIEATLQKDLASLASDKSADASFKKFMTAKQIELIIKRSQSLSSKLRSTKILWFDDQPSNNEGIRKILLKWGASIDCAVTSQEALIYLKNALADSSLYDLIIADNKHPNDIPGTKFAELARSQHTDLDIPFILFSGSYGRIDTLLQYGVPLNIFAATNRYDYLFHFIFDALERGNAPYPANIQRSVYSIDSILKNRPGNGLFDSKNKFYADTLTMQEVLPNGRLPG